VTHTGLLLFGQAEVIAAHCPQAQVHYVHQPSDTAAARNDQWRVGLLLALERIEQTFSGPANPEEELSVGLFKLRVPAFPLDSVREAVLNALTHRDYADPGEVLIRHTPREVVVTSPGGFVGGITVENFLRHEPVARNRTLADALVHDPKLLILDEPTNGLDPVQIRQVRELLRELRTRHTVLLSTHILHEVEVTCDRVIMLNHGRILADDSPRNLASRLNTSTVVRVEVETKDEKAPLKLEGIQGVRKCTEEAVEGGAWRHFMLRVEPGFDVREAVQALATAEAWRVRELHRELPNLEDVFVELASSAEVMKGGRLS
jgi:hypothetical protein